MDQHFDTLIKPRLDVHNPRILLEIGVCEGATTLPLLRWCRDNDSKLISLDPVAWTGDIPDQVKQPYQDYVFKYGDERATPTIAAPYLETAYKEGLFEFWDCRKITSHDYLKQTNDKFDAVFIDGDHNYYTVLNELKFIENKLNEGGSIFLHDVADKWSRTDQYYDPRSIPDEFLYGDKQGVLTAVEDFLTSVGGGKVGRLAHAEELSIWLATHPVQGLAARLKSAVRTLRRGYDNVWIHQEHLSFQKAQNDIPFSSDSSKYAFEILSAQHFGLGVISKAINS